MTYVYNTSHSSANHSTPFGLDRRGRGTGPRTAPLVHVVLRLLLVVVVVVVVVAASPAHLNGRLLIPYLLLLHHVLLRISRASGQHATQQDQGNAHCRGRDPTHKRVFLDLGKNHGRTVDEVVEGLRVLGSNFGRLGHPKGGNELGFVHLVVPNVVVRTCVLCVCGWFAKVGGWIDWVDEMD